MKAKWDSLQPRERMMIAIAGVVLLLFCFYQLLFAPIHRVLTNLRDSTEQNQRLLDWMQATEKKIQTLKNNSISNRTVTTSTLLSTVDESVHKSPIASSLSLLQQGNSNTVEAKFNKVSFDELTQWMIGLRQEYGIEIKQVTINQLTDQGIVQANITLTV